MFAILLLCLCFGSFTYAKPGDRHVRQAAGTCGQTPQSNNVVSFSADGTPLKRIVGGVEANAHSIPWQISLRYNSGQHSCGGSLVRVNGKSESDIVITAAHCIKGFYLEGVNWKWYENKENALTVVLGAHKLSEKAAGEQRLKIKKIIVNPDYVHATQPKSQPGTTPNNDIAILKLASPVTFSKTIQPICLPAKGENLPDGTQGIVSGWGHLFSGQTQGFTDVLRQVLVPIVNSQVCKQNNSNAAINPQTMLCAGFPKGGKDSCQGDSGGPFFFKKPQGFVLHGVVSFGFGCADANTPGVYARVSNFIDWIQNTITAESDVK